MRAKRGSWSRAFLTETVEIGDKYRDVTPYLKNVELFRNEWVHEFYRLKTLISLEQVNTSVSKQSRIFMSKTLAKLRCHGEAKWSGVVNFHCMQMSLVMSMLFFTAMMMRHVHHVFALWQ